MGSIGLHFELVTTPQFLFELKLWVCLHSIGTELTRDDRRKLYSNFGLLWVSPPKVLECPAYTPGIMFLCVFSWFLWFVFANNVLQVVMSALKMFGFCWLNLMFDWLGIPTGMRNWQFVMILIRWISQLAYFIFMCLFEFDFCVSGKRFLKPTKFLVQGCQWFC